MSDPGDDQVELELPPGEPPAVRATCGKMVVELLDTGHGRPVPAITFDPVGRFTPALIQDHIVTFAQAIQRAQAKVRHEQQLAAGDN